MRDYLVLSTISGLPEFLGTGDYGDVRAHWAPTTTRMYQRTLAGRPDHPTTRSGDNPARWGWVWYLELAATRQKYQGEG